MCVFFLFFLLSQNTMHPNFSILEKLMSDAGFFTNFHPGCCVLSNHPIATAQPIMDFVQGGSNLKISPEHIYLTGPTSVGLVPSHKGSTAYLPRCNTFGRVEFGFLESCSCPIGNFHNWQILHFSLFVECTKIHWPHIFVPFPPHLPISASAPGGSSACANIHSSTHRCTEPTLTL